MSSFFDAVEIAPRDPILGLNEQFNADTNPAKVNLGVGVYYDENGKLPLLGCVRAAEKQMVEAPQAARLPAHRRHRRLRQGGAGLVFGADSRRDARAASPPPGARRHRRPEGRRRFPQAPAPDAKVLISDPSWENHRALFKAPASRSALPVLRRARAASPSTR